MANVYKDRERGQEAERFLQNPIWEEAWVAYRTRILEEMESAASGNTELVMHLKRLLTAASAARAHMERIMKEGVFAAKSIELEEKQGRLRKMFG
jgi:hypothetical protein